MKKAIRIISLILAAALILCIAGCGEKAETEELVTRKYTDGEAPFDNDPTATDGFRVGYGRTEMMPDDPVPLGSYGNARERISTGYLNKLYFSCIAITDENDTTMLVMSYDLTQCRTSIVENLREYANDKYGIDKDYIHLSGTHTHSGPDSGISGYRAVDNYNVKILTRAHEAIDIAMADRKHATVYAGETQTHGLNFVRNYYRSDGTCAGDNYGYLSSAPVVSHVKDPDETMRIIKFCRTTSKGAKAKDIVLVNWQAHNHLTGGSQKTDIASDFSGAFRTSLEERKDCYMTFFQGCAGNLNETDTYFPENNITTDYREYGKLLADTALEVYDKLEQYKTGEVKCIRKEFTGPANHQFDHLLNQAREVLAAYNASGKDLNAILPLCREYGIQGNHHASAIINYFTNDKTFSIMVNAYQIGEIGWASGPVEFFDVLGQRIRAGSPYKVTFTQGYTDDNGKGYMPSADAYDYGCYEAYNTRFGKGAGEMCADQLIDMLKELHG